MSHMSIIFNLINIWVTLKNFLLLYTVQGVNKMLIRGFESSYALVGLKFVP